MKGSEIVDTLLTTALSLSLMFCVVESFKCYMLQWEPGIFLDAPCCVPARRCCRLLDVASYWPVTTHRKPSRARA